MTNSTASHKKTHGFILSLLLHSSLLVICLVQIHIPSSDKSEIFLDVSLVSEESISAESNVFHKQNSTEQVGSAKITLADTEATHVVNNTTAISDHNLTGYEKDLSVYLQKYVNLYFPNIAHKYTGQAIARIRIKKNGQIIWSGLENKTNIASIDKAIIMTLKKIHILPAAPDHYTNDQEVELLIPILFNH